ncbi:MAG: hypothetical protein E6R13_00740 [Spirochaetes bacterium]|nr:MAG: hypothetical protein E6R13_00740 [Spirochaetota bacterium]
MEFESRLKIDKYLDIDIYGTYIIGGETEKVFDDFYNSVFSGIAIFQVNASINGLEFIISEFKDLYLQTEAENSNIEDSESELVEINLSDFTKDYEINTTDGDNHTSLVLDSVEINLNEKKIKLLFLI